MATLTWEEIRELEENLAQRKAERERIAQEQDEQAEARRAIEARRRAELEADMSPPDLQELVAKHGDYSQITPEAWAEYDRKRRAGNSKPETGISIIHPIGISAEQMQPAADGRLNIRFSQDAENIKGRLFAKLR
jgi:hypothetical protein